MTCRDLTDFLEAYTSHELADDVRVVFERHLEGCANCRVFLQQYEATVVAGKQAYVNIEESPVPDDLVRAIISSLKDDDA